MLAPWALAKLEPVKDHPRVLVRDPLHLLPEHDSTIPTFGKANGFTVITTASNLAFRWLYEKALADTEVKKVLVVDRAPAGRRAGQTHANAPPPFYPDLLDQTAPEARIELDLRELLHHHTNDPLWPAETNEPRYARLLARHLDGALRAHANLRTAHPGRFSDHDFKTIVACAALGIADSAFKKLDAECLWRIGLLGHEALAELESLAPEITRPILDELRKAPAPFCWLGQHDGETVLRAFYLAVILAQHAPGWRLLLPTVEPALAPFTAIDETILTASAPDLIRLSPDQANRDLAAAEQSLSKDALQFLLLDQLKIGEPAGFTAALEKEAHSTLVRALALLLALDNALSAQPARQHHERLGKVLFGQDAPGRAPFVEQRPSAVWSSLEEAYRLACDLLPLRDELALWARTLKVKKTDQLTFASFWDQWNGKRLNRLEYYLSALDRLVGSAELLPRSEDELPSAFGNALDRARQRVQAIAAEVLRQLDEVNARFQELVVARYASWLATDGEVRLTSQFLRRCVKPHWDAQTEKAVVFIFDGMRYDVWDEMLRPMLLERMDVEADLAASSILPSETEVSRWALSAGTEPASFWPRKAENLHLQDALRRDFGYSGTVEAVAPPGAGTGETVRYRAGNLEVFIFEFCDKELHKIHVKVLPDGREVPSRPLAFIYQQHLKNIIDNEVMAVVRALAPGTKVFVTADHGFGRVHRQRVGLEASWLNDPQDCSYLNAWLRSTLAEVKAPAKVRESVWEMPVSALRMPATEDVYNRDACTTWRKQYASIVFPRVGYALSRPGSHFKPDAYTHGGISMQELMVPMVVLRVKARDQGVLHVEAIEGPAELVEGEEVSFRVRLLRAGGGASLPEELRVDLEAVVAAEAGAGAGDASAAPRELPRQVLYVGAAGEAATFRYRLLPEDASVEERRAGGVRRTVTITASYRDGRKTYRKSRAHGFSVQLNAEQVVRRVGNLGNVLGLTPKSLRGG